MTESARVFVNGVGLNVPAQATALDAVRAWSADAADAVVAGTSIVTDSRGLPTAADARVESGAIFRVIPARARRAGRAPGSADEAP
jgi:hypothetical protein